jgi:hypothetical protein
MDNVDKHEQHGQQGGEERTREVSMVHTLVHMYVVLALVYLGTR